MSGGPRSAALGAATVLLVLAAPRPSAAQTVDTWDHERRVTGLQEIGIAVGALDYTESNAGVSLFDTGASLGSADYSEDPFRTLGDWVAVQSQFAFFSWLALAVRARLGTMTRGPSTVPPSNETVDGGDPSTLDPQLGDPRPGGSVAPIIRFLPGHTALDVGATFSFTSFRPRYGFSFLDAAIQQGLGPRLLAFYGISSVEELDTPKIQAYRADVDVLALMSPDDPPFYVHNPLTPAIIPANENLLFHHAYHARALTEQADKIGLSYIAYIEAVNVADPSCKTDWDYAVGQLSK